MRRRKYALLQEYMNIPKDVSIYQAFEDGSLYAVKDKRISEISAENNFELHTFITPGNKAFYFEGDPNTSHKNPNNATAKLGITKSHHHFEPHTHGSRHLVFSLGYSGALLYDNDLDKEVEIKLKPNSIIEIPGGVPHAFYNRSSAPLLTFIVNSGLGIHNEEYAITKKDAISRGDKVLAKKLEKLELKLNEEIKTMKKVEKIGSLFRAVGEVFSSL